MKLISGNYKSNYYSCSGQSLKRVRPSKTQNLYHENLLLQKFNDKYTQVLTYFFSASDIMEAVRGCFIFYAMNAI